jgi:hypothetical protein
MAVLNAVLRAYFKVGQYHELQMSQQLQQYINADDKWEIDHMFEVQHVVRIVWDIVGLEWQQRPVAEYMDLSSFLNDHRNMYRIPRAANQYKKHIRFDENWRNHEFIEGYLQSEVSGTGWTVSEQLFQLTGEMISRQGENSTLTKQVGEELSWQLLPRRD